MSSLHLIAILALFSRHVVFSTKENEGLRNQHLTIAAEEWDPFFAYDWHKNDMGDYVFSNYRGVMWELLLLMQRARNFTFRMVHSSDGEWGVCYTINNCTGMFGMVNRGEVDLALGKYDFNLDINQVKSSHSRRAPRERYIEQ